MDSRSLPTFRRSVTLRSLIGVVVLFCLLLLALQSDLLLSESMRLDRAAALVEAGEILQAEKLIQPLLHEAHHSPSLQHLYAEILFARGDMPHLRDLLLSRASSTFTDPSTLLRLGTAEFFLGNLDSASLLANRILVQAEQRLDTLLQARAWHLVGRIAFNKAEYDSALSAQRRSLQLAGPIDSKKTEADALRQIGVLYWYRGQNDSALSIWYERALELYHQLRDRSGEATTLSNIGLTYQQKGDWETNLRYQLQAYDIRKKIGDQIGLCDSYYLLTHAPLPRKEAGGLFLGYIQKSLDLSARIGYAWGREVALRQRENFYRTYLQLGATPEAWDDSLQGMPSGEWNLFTVQRKAWKLVDEGDPVEAEPYFRRVVEMADSLHYTSLLTTSLTEYGSILTHLGRFNEAKRSLFRALALAEHGERDHLFWIQGKIAHFLARAGNPRGAKNLLTDTIRQVDSLYRVTLAGSPPDVGFLTALSSIQRNRTELFEQIITLLSFHDDPDLFSFMEGERLLPFWGEGSGSPAHGASPFHRSSKEFIRLLKEYEKDSSEEDLLTSLITSPGELRSSSSTEQKLVTNVAARVLETVPVTIATLSSRLGRREAFIEFYVTGRQIVVQVVRSGTTNVLTIPLPEKDLADLVRVQRETILRGAQSGNDILWMGPARRLYELLLKPIEQRGLITPGDHLILSPHRSLHLVSFPSLLISAKNEPPRFLIEQYDLSLSPSATTWAGPGERSQSHSLLAFYPNPASLPHTGRETEGIPSTIFPEQRTIRGSAANAKLFLTEAPNVDVLHIAGHADLNERFPLFSTIECHDRSLELHEILKLPLKARLVVLSACESGLSTGAGGSIPAGHDLVSLPRAFLTAGAARVVASLWQVEDESTSLLMQEFYQNLTVPSSNTPATPTYSLALNKAQRNRIEAGRRSGRVHPFFWAAFYHTGAR